jgi:hypothetical protein
MSVSGRTAVSPTEKLNRETMISNAIEKLIFIEEIVHL